MLRAALGGTMLFAPPAWALATAVLLAITIARSLRPSAARYTLMFNFLFIFFPAASWNEIAGVWSAGLWAVLTLPPFDDSLRACSQSGLPNVLVKTSTGRRASSQLWSLIVVLTLVVVLAAVIENAGLAVASGVVAAFLLWRLSVSVRRIPREPLLVTPVGARVLAGETFQCQTQVTNSSMLPLNIKFFPDDSRLHVEPVQCNLQNGEAAPLAVRAQTSLAGPREVRLLSAAVDPLGLMLSIQSMTVAKITVVPRARVASWLAHQVLERSATGINRATALSRVPTNSAGQQDYYRHRPYIPGDRGNQIDWRRTLKFRDLIVKEFAGAPSRMAVMVASLQADDEEAMDKLAWDLITYSLTFAQEGIPTAIASYGKDGLNFAAPSGDPNEAVRKSLSLLPKISEAPQDAKALGIPDVSWLRRYMRGKGSPEGIGQTVARFLAAELAGLEFAVIDHPLTKAVSEIKRRYHSAAVFILSRSSAEQDMVAVSKDTLERAGYDVFLVNGDSSPRTTRSSPARSAAGPASTESFVAC